MKHLLASTILLSFLFSACQNRESNQEGETSIDDTSNELRIDTSSKVMFDSIMNIMANSLSQKDRKDFYLSLTFIKWDYLGHDGKLGAMYGLRKKLENKSVSEILEMGRVLRIAKYPQQESHYIYPKWLEYTDTIKETDVLELTTVIHNLKNLDLIATDGKADVVSRKFTNENKKDFDLEILSDQIINDTAYLKVKIIAKFNSSTALLKFRFDTGIDFNDKDHQEKADTIFISTYTKIVYIK